MKSHHLKTPVDADALRALDAGDSVELSGRLFTCRPLAYDRLLDPDRGSAIREKLSRLEADTLFHCGPLVKQEEGGYRILGMVPMPSWLAGPERIRKAVEALDLKVIIGKGSLGSLSDFCCKAGCVHLVCTGNYNEYASRVTSVVDCVWPDLGLPEALWIFEAAEFGPFIVDTDTKGQSLYQQVDAKFRTETETLLAELGIKLEE